MKNIFNYLILTFIKVLFNIRKEYKINKNDKNKLN